MDLLEKLIDIHGVSGDEHEVRDFIVKEARKSIKDITVDTLGNVIVRKKGIKPSIMFLSHMDEIGLMASSISKSGKIYFSPIGGHDPSLLIGQRVFVKGKKDRIKGVITTNEVLNGLDAPNKLLMSDLYVYTGINKKELSVKGVKVGSYITFTENCNFTTLGNDDVISGKALDDRIGCYILLELIKNLKTKNEVYFIFTVQEEIGLYGAEASVFNIVKKPDYAIAVDVTGYDDRNNSVILGKGPVLTIKDAQMIGNKCLNEALQESAKKSKIRLQLEVSEAGATDAASVFVAKGGIPSSVLGVSVANLHTTIGIASKQDVEGAVKILKTFLSAPPTKCWS